MLRPLAPGDWATVREIYLAGLRSQLESYSPRFTDWESWDRGHLEIGRLVAEESGRVIGWAAITRPSEPNQPAEVNVYVAPAAWGQGVGGALLDGLVQAADHASLPVLRASIFRRNEASMRLHLGRGFTPVAVGEPETGLEGDWLETVLLERPDSAESPGRQ